MRKYIKLLTFGLALLMLGFVSCDTADQEVSPVASPANYPTATFTTDFTGSTIAEGDTLKYTITLDKAIDRSLTFECLLTGGTADEGDVTLANVILVPWTTEIEFEVVINEDNFPEVAETLSLEIGVFGIAERYMLNAATVNPKLNLTITNVNLEDTYTVAFGWPDSHDDFDLRIYKAPSTQWSDDGEGSGDPEISVALWDTDPDGTYYITVLPYAVAAQQTNYTISLGHSDQTVSFITGVYDKTATYTKIGSWSQLVQIDKVGTVYTITNLNPTVK